MTFEPGLLPHPHLLAGRRALASTESFGEEGVLRAPAPRQGPASKVTASPQAGDWSMGMEGGGGLGKGNKKRLHFLKGTLAVC